MKCVNCGRPTEGGYCDCMIVYGVFKGAWWVTETTTKPQTMGEREKLAFEIETFMSAQGISLDDGIWYLLEALADETR
ncbi:hypothetical protein [Exiguobacterium sp. s22]|uniref:hypothetical protein n=1 Tax=Exiguobacterium sp. s22 TaxID=2751272 RepID=UPI001BE9E058|nr:hypothetical protein [Exiguobacterium sp. s22]